MTYIRILDGWIYLAAILDLFSRRVVGWSLADIMEVALPLAALRGAIEARKLSPGLIHHSDRGTQYASVAYQQALASAGICCSMSRKGECWDNAVSESFFGWLKEELIYRETWQSMAQLTRSVDDWIDGFYNPRRRHPATDQFSPLEYEVIVAKGGAW